MPAPSPDLRLVFHLGDRKTGSTSIQDTLRSKNWAGGEELNFPAVGLHHSSLAKALQDGATPSMRNSAFANLKESFSKLAPGIAVISSENFEDVDGVVLRNALQKQLPAYLESAKFIAYVRPHADRVVSSWAERVKLGQFSGDLEAYLDSVRRRGRFNYLDRFQGWRKAFGERFQLRPMIRAELHKNCVVRDFLSFALGTTDFRLLSEPSANESLSVADLAVLQELHAVLGVRGRGKKDKSRQAIGRNFALQLSSLQRQKIQKPALHKSLVPVVQEMFSQDAAAMDAAFFEGAPLTRALAAAGDKAVDEPQSIRAEDHFGPDELRLIHAYSEFLGQMAMIAPEAWAKHFTTQRLSQSKSVQAPAGRPAEATMKIFGMTKKQTAQKRAG